MKNQKINALFLLGIGILLGVALCSLFARLAASHPEMDSTIISPKAIQKEVAQSEAHYQQQIQALEQSNSQWQAQSKAATQALNLAKRKTVYLERKLATQIAKDKALSSGQKDSLYQSLNDYTTVGNEKDSLCTEITTALEAQIVNKDSTIVLQNKQYEFLKGSFELSIAQQQTAIAESNLYKKQMKRERTKKKFLSAGLIVVGGLAAYSLLQR